ncbi:1267_t:CDS:2 [Racocetra persica]|uniref:1267_t:CDS:1 n=1 Tax=Racocetra persica TaxID=160502 RepID=A0ACA9NRY0_9GLOM|nr:1267_t:CDS:2 [Racocetra persica]
MPCYADTIIKVKHVKQSGKEDAKMLSVWAIRTYPTGREDNEIEVILFIPINPNDRDSKSQAIFKRDEPKVLNKNTGNHLTLFPNQRYSHALFMY